MYHGRGSGGRKQYKWEEHAAQAFKSFFGKRSGSPLPAAPPDAPLSEADHAASSSDEELPPPSPRVLSTTPFAWDANGRPTLSVRVEPRSPVPISGDEDYYEALLSEPLLSHEDVCDDSPPFGHVHPPPLQHGLRSAALLHAQHPRQHPHRPPPRLRRLASAERLRSQLPWPPRLRPHQQGRKGRAGVTTPPRPGCTLMRSQTTAPMYLDSKKAHELSLLLCYSWLALALSTSPQLRGHSPSLSFFSVCRVSVRARAVSVFDL